MRSEATLPTSPTSGTARGLAEALSVGALCPDCFEDDLTLGADKAYDAEDFVNELRSMNSTPHAAQNTNARTSAINGRITRQAGCAISQRIRKRIKEGFG
jgi:hypothetical protein